MPSGKGEIRALIAVRVIALAPLLWFLLAGGAVGKIVGKDWLPREAFVWPLMIAPVLMAAVYVLYRRDIQCAAEKVPDVRWLYRIAAGLFIIANGPLVIFYTWVAVIPVALCVVLLLDGLIKRSAKPAP
ncbi:hypothetical protein [Streptomyces olivaceiscleroticus]|uniref:Uncharacterized protein n=1 Tax=Streptomyces olivaceiscleroticus TaxID=68245 RepID=A0ABN0ZRQ2_9ACTN